MAVGTEKEVLFGPAKRRLENVALRWGDAKSLPFGHDLFDVVVSSFMLPHFAKEEKIDVLKEMLRVLKPGGRLGLLFGLGGFCGMYLGARTQKFVPANIIKGLLSAMLMFLAGNYIIQFIR